MCGSLVAGDSGQDAIEWRVRRPVRLSMEEVETIKSTVTGEDPEARVYLFGSRADDNARGGHWW